MNLQRLLIAAAGIALGWAGGAGSLARAQGDAQEAIVITVLLPADAVLLIDDNKTQSAGEVRTFRTPPLAAGRPYTYTLKATAGGKEVTRTIRVAHGGDNAFDLRGEFPAAAARPGSRQIVAAGYQQATAGAARAGRGDPRDEEAIAKNAEAFVEALHKADADALAAFWAPDGDFTDLEGRHLKGREAIAGAFKKMFAQQKGLKVAIESQSLRFPTPDSAIEDGVSEVFPPDGGPPSRARYTILHVKKDGKWLLSSVRETPFTPPSNSERLGGLEWALGNWEHEADNGEVQRLSLEWSDGQQFIVAHFSTTARDAPVGSAVQWIGWDPLAKRIRSWVFDSTGSFGEGTWTADGNKWVVKTTSVLQDGKKAAKTYVLTRVDADTLTLQATERSVDGHALPDTGEIKMKRSKGNE
jgi:uncharacterized protein (TIGR02246 family)